MLAPLFHSLAVTAYSYTTTTTTSSSSSLSSTFWVTYFAVIFVVAIFAIIAMWKVFTKAGKPGWASIVPIYNSWVTFEIGGKPGWWALLGLIPFVNFIVIILVIMAYVEISKRFGKSPWFAVLLIFLIGWFILAFGKAKYNNPEAPLGQAAPTGPVASPLVGAAPQNTDQQPPTPPAAPTNLVQ